MKKTKLIIAFLSLGLQVMAQTNNLIVFDQQGEKFWAILNGMKQNADPQTNVKIEGLNANTYKLKLIFQDSTKPAIDKTVYYQNMGTEETMNVVVKNNGERVLRYVSAVPLAQAAPPMQGQSVVNYGVAPTQSVGGSTTVVTQQTTTTSPDGGASVGMNVNGVSMGMNVTGVQAQQTTVTTTTTTSTGDASYNQGAPPPTNSGYVMPGYNGPVGCPMPMSHEDFESAKNTIASKDFENTKLDIAKQIVSSNCLLAEQVRAIMKLFTFENSKLEFAKFAYAHTYDKGNYFKVNDAFQFDSSASDLSSYISSH